MNSFLKKSIIFSSLCLSGLVIFNSCQKDVPGAMQSEQPATQQSGKFQSPEGDNADFQNMSKGNTTALKQTAGKIVIPEVIKIQLKRTEKNTLPTLPLNKQVFITKQGLKVGIVKTASNKVVLTFRDSNFKNITTTFTAPVVSLDILDAPSWADIAKDLWDWWNDDDTPVSSTSCHTVDLTVTTPDGTFSVKGSTCTTPQ